MTTFTAGPNGGNLLNLLNIGTTTRQTVTSTETDSYLSSGQRSVFYGSFQVNAGGTTASGGTITGWSLFGANGQLNWSITGVHADLATLAKSTGNAATAMFLPAGTTYIGSSNPSATDLLVGVGGGDTYIGGAASETYETAGGTNTIRGGSGTNTVLFSGSFSSYSFAATGGNSFTITDSVVTRNGIDNISGVQSLKFTDITVTIGADNHLALPTTTASQAVFWGNEIVHSTGFDPINISDSSANVVSQLGSLESMAKIGQLGTIALTNSGITTLNLTPDQVTSDAAALKAISTPVVIDVSVPTANTSFAGTGEPGTVVVFSGKASQYNIFATGGGGVTVVDNGTGRSSADHFANITALQFSDQTDFVANAPATSGATTGNITELYSAAFGRQPDVLGLAYYQQMLIANPSTPLTTFASNFLASPEYKNNAAHNYAQGTSGDTQFVNDLYTNLLHRSPETGAVPYYLNLINLITAGTTQGTTAYTTALANAHAVVMTDVSQSPEFVGDVQVTGQTSTSGHWLILS